LTQHDKIKQIKTAASQNLKISPHTAVYFMHLRFLYRKQYRHTVTMSIGDGEIYSTPSKIKLVVLNNIQNHFIIVYKNCEKYYFKPFS